MKVFIAALDEGGLRKAGRKLGRSPAAISRALAFLEAHVGVTLLHRTTRSFKLSEAGERYAVVFRRVILDLEEADLFAAGGGRGPPGPPAQTGPSAGGGGGIGVGFVGLLGRPPARLFQIVFFG